MIRKRPFVDFIELHILHHSSEAPLYGLWMIEELAEHGYRVRASHLYPRFHRMERLGFLKREDRVVEGKLRKYYRLTSTGRTYWKEQKRRLSELVAEACSTAEIRWMLERRLARDGRKRPRAGTVTGNK